MKVTLLLLLLALTLVQVQGGWIHKKKVSHSLVSQDIVPLNVDAIAVRTTDGPRAHGFECGAVPSEVEAHLQATPLGPAEKKEIAEWAAVAGQTDERKFQFKIADGVATATLVTVTATKTADGRVSGKAQWLTCSADVHPQRRLVEKKTKKKKFLGVTYDSDTWYETKYVLRDPTVAEHDAILAKLSQHGQTLLAQ